MWPHEINWALATGHESGVVVVDVDPRNGGDETAALLGLPPTRESITGGGGFHAIYSVTEPTRSRKLGPGVDFQADGKYVILPPGRHASGRQYAWRDATVPIEPLPDGLSQVGTQPMTVDNAATVQAFREGSRNDGLYSALSELRLLGQDAATVRMVAHAMNRTRCVPPLEDNEVERVVGSVLNLEPIPASSRAWALNLGRPSRSAPSRLVTGGSFVLDEPATIPALWGAGDQVLWAEGEGLMVAGQQGVGKTTIAQQLVLHRVGARAGGFLGLPVARSDAPVLYLAMDRPRQAARSMRRMVAPEHRSLLDERLRFFRGPLPVNPLASPSVLADFMEDVCPECDLLVLDSLKDLAPGLSKDDVGAQVNLAVQEVIARGRDLIALHHGRKAGGGQTRGRSIDDVYGSTWLTSGLGSVILLDGEPGDPTVTLHHVKQPAEPVGPLTVRHDHPTGSTVVYAGTTDLLTALKQRHQDGTGLTVEEAAALTLGRVDRTALAKTRRALDRLVDTLQATRTDAVNLATGKVPATYKYGGWVVEQ